METWICGFGDANLYLVRYTNSLHDKSLGKILYVLQ